MKKFIVILLIVPLFSGITFSQHKQDRIQFKDDNTALQDSNITLMGVWPAGSCNGVFVRDNYAYIGRGSTMEILEISDHSNPVSVGWVMTEHLIDGIYVSNSYAYVISADEGLYIIDISEPTNPYLCGYYDTVLELGFRSIYVLNNFAYLITANAATNGLHIVDISDPFNPFEAGYYDTGTGEYDVWVADSLAYVTSYFGLHIISLSDPNNPFQIGLLPSSGNNYFYYLFVKDNYAFITGGYGTLHIIDVSNPSNPTEIVAYQTGCNFATDLFIANNYAFVYGIDYKLYIIDISDPANPQAISSYNVGAWSFNIYVSDNFVFITGIMTGLHIVDVEDPSNPIEAGFYYTGGSSIYDAYVMGDYAYITNQQNSHLNVIDIDDPFDPKLTGYCYLGDIEPNIYVQDNYAFVAGGSSDFSTGYLRIIDISNPTNPVQVSQYDLGSPATSIFVAGEYTYTTTAHQLQIFDISDPANPKYVSNYNLGNMHWADEIFISGNYAFIAGAYFIPYYTETYIRLFIINILDPRNPQLETIYEGSNGSAYDIYIKYNYAFITCVLQVNDLHTEGWLDVFDISDPSNPEIIGGYFNYDQVLTNIQVKDNYAYLGFVGSYAGTEDGGLVILDISEISDLQEAGFYNAGDLWGRIFAYDEYVCLTKRTVGLLILRNDLLTAIKDDREIPKLFFLSQNYPNPWNPSTKIQYSVPQSSNVNIKVFDILGNEIETLVNEEKPAGTYELTWNASNLPSGVYFSQLKAVDPSTSSGQSFVQIKKMLLLK